MALVLRRRIRSAETGIRHRNSKLKASLFLAVQEPDAPFESSSGTATILFVVFLGSLAIGTVLVCLLRPHTDTISLPSSRSDAVSPVVSHPGLAKASFRLISEKKILLLIFPFFYTGMQQAFVWCVVVGPSAFLLFVVDALLAVSVPAGSIASFFNRSDLRDDSGVGFRSRKYLLSRQLNSKGPYRTLIAQG